MSIFEAPKVTLTHRQVEVCVCIDARYSRHGEGACAGTFATVPPGHVTAALEQGSFEFNASAYPSQSF